MTARTEPFDGIPPDVAEGDAVWCRDAADQWHPMVATGPARYDFPNAIGGRCWLTVPVVRPDVWPSSLLHPVNWPAEDVRRADPGLVPMS